MGIKEDLVFRVARRWISGKDMAGGLEGARAANSRGMGAILNYLGEDVTDPAQAERVLQEYQALQRAIREGGVDGCVSVKLSQLGLLVDDSLVLQNAERLAATADALNEFMWIDMEGSGFTEKTIALYLKLLERHRSIGVALQAYLKRSEADLTRLLDAGASIRLVKGAYREPPDIAYTGRERIREVYSSLMNTLFERCKNFAVGTHDSVLIDEARALSAKHGTKFEFELLKGIRDDLKPELVASGFRVVEYIPYGDQWYPYSMRRMREHPSNVWLLMRSML